MWRRRIGIVMFVLIVSAPGASNASVGDAAASLADAANDVECAYGVALEFLHRGVGLAPRWAPCTEIVSVGADGTPSDRQSWDPTLSADGLLVAFASFSNTFAPGLPTNTGQIYVHDRATGALALLSTAVDGTPGDGSSGNPAISGDGRHVIFETTARNLGVASIGTTHVVLRDRDLDGNGIFDETEPGAIANYLISRRSGGGSTSGRSPAISSGDGVFPPGRFVAFAAEGVDVVGMSILGVQVYLLDRDLDGNGIFDEADVMGEDPKQAFTWISEVAFGSAGLGVTSTLPAINADGRYVTFHSTATNILPEGEDMNGAASDVFIRDRDTDGDAIYDEPDAVATLLANISTSGEQGNSSGVGASISDTGRFVAFHSSSSNLDPACTGASLQMYIRDRDTDDDGVFDEPGAVETFCISVNAQGIEGNGECAYGGISPDGRFVVYTSLASNLVPGDTNGKRDIFVYDRVGDTTTLVSRRNDGSVATEDSGAIFRFPAVVAPPDGPVVAFESLDDLLTADGNGPSIGVFVRDFDATTLP